VVKLFQSESEAILRVTELCPSPHLEALDIGDEIGASAVVTILRVEVKEVGAEKVKKGVVFVEEFGRGLVLNKTNSRTIADLLGMNTDDWIGKKVTLYRSETSFQNKTVPCIRVKDSLPAAAASEAKRKSK
jgi:hypothetical protein